MKRFSLLMLIAFFATTTLAQEKPIISSAVIAWQKPVSKESLQEAKMYIDRAREVIESKPLSEVNPKQLPKFYFYYGDIYFRISVGSNAEIRALDPDATEKALWGYQQVIDFEKNEKRKTYSKDAQNNLKYVVGNFVNRGISRADLQDYKGAAADFMLVFDLKKNPPFNVTDTTMLYNAAIMLQNLEDKSKSLDLYMQLIELGYHGITFTARDAKKGEPMVFETRAKMEEAITNGTALEPKISESLLPSLYVTAAALAKSLGKKELSDKVIAEGRQRFPNENDLILLELQDYLDAEDYDGALKNLKLAVDKDPKNALYWYNIGFIYQTKMKQLEPAREAYNKAIEVNPNSFDAMYMLGFSYVAEANAFTEKMNKLSFREEKKFNQLKKEQERVFKVALGYFEKAYAVNPGDTDVINALSEIHLKLGNVEKALKFKEEAEAKQ
jgi:tetratricopeptide (TPR) repeat protein